jgi:hypothetical protein
VSASLRSSMLASESCGTDSGGRCNCEPSYRAEVFSARDKRKLRKTRRRSGRDG